MQHVKEASVRFSAKKDIIKSYFETHFRHSKEASWLHRSFIFPLTAGNKLINSCSIHSSSFLSVHPSAIVFNFTTKNRKFRSLILPLQLIK